MLFNLTIAINLIALVSALGLGIYIVARSSLRAEAWLAALAVWCLGGYFLNHLLALQPPSTPPLEARTLLYHLMLFWPRDVFELGWKGWLLGWLPAYSVIFWYHATLYMLPGPFTRRRLVGALLGYAAALAGILVKAQYMSAWISMYQDPLYDAAWTFPFFALSSITFVIFGGLSILILAHSSPASIPGGLNWLLVTPLLLVAANGLIEIASPLLDIPIPQALTALVLLAALLLAGIGVARRSALLDVRPDLLKLGEKVESSPDFQDLSEQAEPIRELSVHTVELALRNLNNYAYLADTPLSDLRLVARHLAVLESGAGTHIDRGKAVSETLSEIVLKLKPTPEDAPNPLPRAWYAYTILWEAYVENKPNLEIMSRLYISEGTFNRIRKEAVRSVTRILLEIETHSVA